MHGQLERQLKEARELHGRGIVEAPAPAAALAKTHGGVPFIVVTSIYAIALKAEAR